MVYSTTGAGAAKTAGADEMYSTTGACPTYIAVAANVAVATGTDAVANSAQLLRRVRSEEQICLTTIRVDYQNFGHADELRQQKFFQLQENLLAEPKSLSTSPPLQAESTVSLRAVARSKATCCR